MSKITDRIKIEIANSNVDGKQQYTVLISMPAEDFIFSDGLARRGAIRGLEPKLRSVIRDAVAAYIRAGDEFIKQAMGANHHAAIPRKRGKRKMLPVELVEVS